MAKFFYEDRIHPVTKAELDAAHEAHHHDEVAGGEHGETPGLDK
jgi:ubiquinol-cytochrome c reductase cytochrome b subunit